MRLIALFLFSISGLLAGNARAQEWPAKPIRVVVPYTAGGVSEAIFRAMSTGIESRLGQRFYIENKPGADGNIGTSEVVRAANDGEWHARSRRRAPCHRRRGHRVQPS